MSQKWVKNEWKDINQMNLTIDVRHNPSLLQKKRFRTLGTNVFHWRVIKHLKSFLFLLIMIFCLKTYFFGKRNEWINYSLIVYSVFVLYFWPIISLATKLDKRLVLVLSLCSVSVPMLVQHMAIWGYESRNVVLCLAAHHTLV